MNIDDMTPGAPAPDPEQAREVMARIVPRACELCDPTPVDESANDRLERLEMLVEQLRQHDLHSAENQMRLTVLWEKHKEKDET